MARQTETMIKIPSELCAPVRPLEILRKRHALKRQLLSAADDHLQPCRIAILGGSTTQEVKSILELFLLSEGIQPTFYESEYNAYFEEITFENPKLREFKPDVVFVHTTWQNVRLKPQLLSEEKAVEELVRREMDRFEHLWSKIHQEYGAVVIQNNFDLPPRRPLGNLDGTEPYGRVAFLLRLNAEFARYARSHSKFLINDILYLAAQVGLTNWFVCKCIADILRRYRNYSTTWCGNRKGVYWSKCSKSD
jgi:predicted enzyme involved in methoxymalonyl-ACP biosynthesis